MTQKISDNAVSGLVRRLVDCEANRQSAVRRQKISIANRWFDKSSAVLKELDATPEGRSALEQLLAHSSGFVRLSAAATVRKWAPGLAIPVLADLCLAEPGPEVSMSERNSIYISAKGLLYRHFGITSFDPDDLVEPLKALGVTWPTEKERQEAHRRRGA